MTFQEKIRHLRKKRGWTQALLAKKVGVRTGHISRIETGRYQPSVDLLRRFTQVLEVTADYLLNEAEGEFAPVTVKDKGLTERLRLLDTLDSEERSALLRILDALLTKKKFVDLVAREAGLATS